MKKNFFFAAVMIIFTLQSFAADGKGVYDATLKNQGSQNPASTISWMTSANPDANLITCPVQSYGEGLMATLIRLNKIYGTYTEITDKNIAQIIAKLYSGPIDGVITTSYWDAVGQKWGEWNRQTKNGEEALFHPGWAIPVKSVWCWNFIYAYTPAKSSLGILTGGGQTVPSASNVNNNSITGQPPVINVFNNIPTAPVAQTDNSGEKMISNYLTVHGLVRQGVSEANADAMMQIMLAKAAAQNCNTCGNGNQTTGSMFLQSVSTMPTQAMAPQSIAVQSERYPTFGGAVARTGLGVIGGGLVLYGLSQLLPNNNSVGFQQPFFPIQPIGGGSASQGGTIPLGLTTNGSASQGATFNWGQL